MFIYLKIKFDFNFKSQTSKIIANSYIHYDFNSLHKQYILNVQYIV